MYRLRYGYSARERVGDRKIESEWEIELEIDDRDKDDGERGY
jgi:hypothetical protein